MGTVTEADLDSLKRKHEAARLSAELATLQACERLAESTSSEIDIDPEEGLWSQVGQPRLGSLRGRWASSAADRSEGRYQPYYGDELDLRRMWNASRNMEAFASISEGLLEGLAGYVIGTGFSFKAKAKPNVDPETVKPLVQATQRFIDQFSDRNSFPALIDDIHKLSRVDGECPIALYPGSDSIPVARLIDVHCITEPSENGARRLNQWGGRANVEWGDDGLNSWTFGVHTRRDRRTGQDISGQPLGYRVIHDLEGTRSEYITRDRMELFRRNVPTFAKRGVSDFFKTLHEIEREAKLRRNTEEGVSILAAIAFIKEFPSGQSTAPSIAGGDVIAQARSRLGGGARSVTTQRFHPGTIPNLTNGTKYQPGPLAQMNTGAVRDVANAALRAIGLRWQIPGWMMTGDTETALYSAVLAMGSPFVNARTRDQRFYRERCLRLLWKAVRMAGEAGWFQGHLESIERSVEIECVVPDVAIESREARVTRQTQEIAAGILSQTTAIEESGRDPKLEKARIKSEREEAPRAPQPSMDDPAFFGRVAEGVAARIFEGSEYP